MKKSIVMILSIFILIPGVVFALDSNYVNYYGVEMNDDQYNNLLELGFSENEIYYMTEDDFNYNKKFEGKLGADVTNYYVNIIRYDATGRIVSDSNMQVSKEAYEGNVVQPLSSADGYIETVYKKLRTTISKSGDYYRYKVNLIWKQMPKVRSYDIIGIGIEPDVFVVSRSYKFSQTYCSASACKTTGAYNSNSVGPTGSGASFALPTANTLISIEATFYFDVDKDDPDSTVVELDAYGDYAHAIKTIPGGTAQGFYLNQSGVTFYEGIEEYYDDMDKALAYLQLNW